MTTKTSKTLCEVFAKAAGEPIDKAWQWRLSWAKDRMDAADAVVTDKLLALNRVIDAGFTAEQLSGAMVEYIQARKHCAEVTDEYYALENGKEKA